MLFYLPTQKQHQFFTTDAALKLLKGKKSFFDQKIKKQLKIDETIFYIGILFIFRKTSYRKCGRIVNNNSCSEERRLVEKKEI